MTRLARAAATAVVTLAAFAPLTGCASVMGQFGAKAEAATPVALSPEEQAVLAETNMIRKAHGLSQLTPDAKLVAVARARSRDMLKRDYLDYVTPEGRSVFMIMRDNKVAFSSGGENIAKTLQLAAKAPHEVVAGWAKAPADRTNLLSEGFSRVGIGAIRSTDGKSVVVTEIFAD